MIECPNCGEYMNYQGMDDGGGDYGEAVVEIWKCEACGEEIEAELVASTVLSDWHDDEDHFVPGYQLTARGRIERAVQSVCEAAAKIRQKLTGKAPELPF